LPNQQRQLAEEFRLLMKYSHIIHRKFNKQPYSSAAATVIYNTTSSCLATSNVSHSGYHGLSDTWRCLPVHDEI